LKKYFVVVVVVLVAGISLFFLAPNFSKTGSIELLTGGIQADTSKKDTSEQSTVSLLTVDTVAKGQILFIYPLPKEQMHGKNVLITMGGMGAKLSWVQKWTEELYKAKLKEFNIGLIIVVMGPVEEYYDSRDIDIPKMTRRFVAAYEEFNFDQTYLIVHSSGVFPAHQMFDYLYIGGNDPKNKKMKMRKLEKLDPKGITKEKITYIMLDGELGKPKGYTLVKEMVQNLKKIYSFYVVDAATKTPSGMAHEAKKVKEEFPDKTILYKHIAENTGCNPGAKWCVHETLIINRPHNPARYDLEKDYQLFDSTRKVVTGYMGVVKNGKWKE